MEIPAPHKYLPLLLAAVCPLSAHASEEVLQFDGGDYVSGGLVVELARTPQAAREATRTIFPFDTAAPDTGYAGPPFSFGYEVLSSDPVNLTVAPDKCGVEDDFANGPDQRNDAITVVANASWPETGTFSVAAAAVFPTSKFSLDSLAYSALNWTGNESYNEKLRHRWIVQTGGKYYVSTGFLGRTGRSGSDTEAVDVLKAERSKPGFDSWVEYDPTATIFADFTQPSVQLGAGLDEVTAVGLYMDSCDFSGRGAASRQWQFKLLKFTATGGLSQ